MAEAALQEVYSSLLPTKGGRLILPRSSIAEVMGYSKPHSRPEDAPEWLLGMIRWQGQEIPLISFEAAAGQPLPDIGRRSRITVIYAIGGKLTPSVFAIATQGYPYLVRVNPNVLHLETEGEVGGPVLARLRMANERPVVPDLELLEDMLAAALGLGSVSDTLHGEEDTPEIAAAPLESFDDDGGLDTLSGADELDSGTDIADAIPDAPEILEVEGEVEGDNEEEPLNLDDLDLDNIKFDDD